MVPKTFTSPPFFFFFLFFLASLLVFLVYDVYSSYLFDSLLFVLFLFLLIFFKNFLVLSILRGLPNLLRPNSKWYCKKQILNIMLFCKNKFIGDYVRIC